MDGGMSLTPGIGGAARSAPAFCKPWPEADCLAATIETEILPRLLLAHRTSTLPNAAANSTSITTVTLNEFIALVLGHDVTLTTVYVETLRTRGVGAHTIISDLIIPCARHLGDLWDNDLADFVQVTLALTKLQQLLRTLGPELPRTVSDGHGNRYALLVPAPGEQHTLGIRIVEEYFRSAGWQVDSEPADTSDALVRRAAANWFAMIGLSVSGVTHLDDLSTTIGQMRQRSANAGVQILVGGPMLLAQPDLVGVLGADGTAAGAAEAVNLAQVALTHAVLPF